MIPNRQKIKINFSVIIIFTLTTLIFSSVNPPHHLWHLEKIQAQEAWEVTKGNNEIIVAVIDTGIDFTHPALTKKAWKNINEIPENDIDDDQNGYVDDVWGWDFYDNDNDPTPDNNHGTFVAGMITAGGNGYKNIGIAPNISIMNLKLIGNEEKLTIGSTIAFADAIDYAVENGAKIIQMSISLKGNPSFILKWSINQAYDNNVALVGITGNSGKGVTFPGLYSEVIAISAITSSNTVTTYSGKGYQNELCAPGDDVYGIDMNSNSLVVGSGTSYASPLVSGTIALMLSVNPGLSVGEIRKILSNTATDLGEVGRDFDYGHGLLNASGAVHSALVINN
ncbi:MAG: S8 family serine peptidase [Candidatus Hodarchaeales archaeon]|jgi:subtilisin family serine protease